MKYDINAKYDVVVPSDVFADEPTVHAGYARASVELTFTADQSARVGTIVEYDPVAMTAVLSETGIPEVETNKIGIFFGRDVRVDAGHFERLYASEEIDGETVKVVVITRGDGSGQVSPSFLDFAGTDFYTLTEAQQDAFRAHLEQEMRMKFVKQQKRVV